MNCRIHFCLLLLTAFLLKKEAGAQSPFAFPAYRSYTPADGLPGLQATYLFQDRAGFLWIGTKTGLARWDGKRFRSWGFAEGLRSGVGAIQQLPDGRMICVSFSGVYILNGERLSPLYGDVRMRFYLAEGFVDGRQLYMLLDKSVYAKDQSGRDMRWILRFEPADCSFRICDSIAASCSPLTMLSPGNAVAYYRDSLGRGCCALVRDGKVLRRQRLPFALRVASTRRQGQDAWVTDTAGQVYEALATKGDSISFRQRSNSCCPVPFSRVAHFAADGSIYFFNEDGELFRRTLSGDQRMLAANDPWEILEDKERNLWIAGGDGLIHLFPNSFAEYKFNIRPGRSDFIWCIAQAADSSYWFASYHTGLFQADKRLQHVRQAVYRKASLEDPSYCIYHHPVRAGKSLYFPCDGGALRPQGNRLTMLRREGQSSLFLYADPKDGRIWSCGNALCYESGDSLMPAYSGEALGLEKRYVLSVCRDRKGALWYAAGTLIGRIEPDGRVKHWDFSGKAHISALAVDGRGNIWAAGRSGLYYYDYRSLRRINHPQLRGAIGALHIYGTRLIIQKQDGIAVLHLDSFHRAEQTIALSTYTAQNGYPGLFEGQNSLWQDGAGYVWIPTEDRLFRVHPDSLLPPPPLSAPIIQDLAFSQDRSNWTSILPGKAVDLDGNQNNLRVYFSSNSIGQGDRLIYRCRLLPHNDWTITTDGIVDNLNNIQDGCSYRFEAECSYDGLHWSAPVRSGIIRIRPLFRNRLDVRIGSIILLMAVAAFAAWKTQQGQKRRLQRRSAMQRLRLQTVRAKNIPHFTGNAYNAILGAIRDDSKERADRLVTLFARFHRLQLSGLDLAVHSLRQELNFIVSYLEVERERFNGHLNYEIAVPESMMELPVPRPSLFVYVENAVKHGLELRKGTGTVTIEAQVIPDGVWLSVVDDGVGLAVAMKRSKKWLDSGGLGLSMLAQQLALHNESNKRKIRQEVTDLPSGTRFSLFIPNDFQYEST